MAWGDTIPEEVATARLLLSSPEFVYQFLTTNNLATRFSETALRSRDDRLINLGLAQFARSGEIVGELYNSAKAPTNDAQDVEYKRALRIACLSNVVTGRIKSRLWGSINVQELIDTATSDEQFAFFNNHTIPTEYIEHLFERTHEFEKIDDDRWRLLIKYVSDNPRLNTGFIDRFGIHRALFRLLEIAPTTMDMLLALIFLFVGLSPSETAGPDRIEHVLERWSNVEIKNNRGGGKEGFYTDLNIRDEFRCLIAALDGRRANPAKAREKLGVYPLLPGFEVFGSRDSQDVALRCAYYGKASLNASDMEFGYKRDGSVFVFAALNNRASC